ncbi:enoyl-CoA hydratase/isomerase family protein [Amycolatopsis pithecellobii]|uniref:Enoyl-CoA hydratase/isomerase family protein n=1 Tax=Amycolatopsis pithecellobii TaxID=664692 RepID=A0A6N7YU58_9PSEU|nr:enoyl-CoA hydratase-related protein [Amycolatopsis pithecellobii]MTD55472.1 enoyl-CoA hydratase/isomerase family protein [Amycolatopsis pithecellobii]
MSGANETGDAVLIERRGSALWLRLNRPEALNGISPEILAGLDAGLDRAATEPGIRAVVLAAVGEVFCAGADLKYVKAITAPAPGTRTSGHQQFLQAAGEVLSRIEGFELPVIAAVQGLAVAGGLELVLCADLVVAAESARFGDAHANYGLLPGGGGSIRLPRRVGPARAKYLLFTGESLPARDFLGTDLVNEVVPGDRLDETVHELVEKIARKSVYGLRRMKELVADGLDAPLAEGLRMELQHSAAHEESADFAEGLTAFFEKRRPAFSEK